MGLNRTIDPEDWVDRYGDHLYSYALFRLGDHALAEDAVQETFMAALRSRESFSGRSSERTWLTGILKHKIVDCIRKISRERPWKEIENLSEKAEPVFDEKGRWIQGPSRWPASPRKLLEKKEFWEALKKCLSELPPRLGQAFLLREMDEMKTDKVCKALGITTTNLWVMIHRARLNLRRCLEVNWFGRKEEETQ